MTANINTVERWIPKGEERLLLKWKEKKNRRGEFPFHYFRGRLIPPPQFYRSISYKREREGNYFRPFMKLCFGWLQHLEGKKGTKK